MSLDDILNDKLEQHPETPKRAWRWWAKALLNIALALALFWGLSTFMARNLLKSGIAAPEFTLRDMQGKPVRLSEFRGKKVLLLFWAPWCRVCRWEVGAINELNRDKKLAVLSVVLDYGTKGAVQKFIEEQKVEYPVLLGDRKLARAYRVDTFPTMYVLDKRGRVEHTVIGYSPEFTLRLRIDY